MSRSGRGLSELGADNFIQREWSEAKEYFHVNPASYHWKNKYQPVHQSQIDETFFYGHEYIRTPDGKIYQIWNRENTDEVVDYQERYGTFGHGAHSHVEYAIDEFGEVFIAKFVAKYDRQENKLCELARTLISQPVGIDVGIESSFIDGDGVEFVSIMRFLGKTLNHYFNSYIDENSASLEFSPKFLLDQMYNLGIKICLAVYQYNNGEALSGQSCALLDIKPDNILVDCFGNVHVVDLGSVSMGLAEACREITGSPAAMLPIKAGIEITNLQQNMVGLLRTLFLPKEFFGASREGEKFLYKREPGDFAIFDEQILTLLDQVENLEKIAWLLARGDEIADIVESLPESALDLAFLLMRAKKAPLTYLQEQSKDECDKSDLLKQALINISLVDIEMTPQLEEQVSNSISLQAALVALGKFEKSATENYLTGDNVLRLCESADQCLEKINALMLSATRFFSQNSLSARVEDSLSNDEKPLSLIQQAILTLVESDIKDEVVWQKVLDNNIQLQQAFLLLRQPGLNVIALGNNIQSLVSAEKPIAEAASILKGISKNDREGRFPDYIEFLISLDILNEHPVWESVAQKNCSIQNAIIILGKDIQPKRFLNVISRLVADEGLQAIVDELILFNPALLTDEFLCRLISKEKSFKKAVDSLLKFNSLWIDKSNLQVLCESDSPVAAVENCIMLSTCSKNLADQSVYSLNVGIVKKSLKESIGYPGAAKGLVRLCFFDRREVKLAGNAERRFVLDHLDKKFKSSGSEQDAKLIILQFLRIAIQPSGLLAARRRLDITLIEIGFYLSMATDFFGITKDDISNAIMSPSPGNGVITVRQLKCGFCRPPNLGDSTEPVNITSKTLTML